MSMYHCPLCDQQKDSDFLDTEDWMGEMACQDCVLHQREHLAYLGIVPEGWTVTYWAKPIPIRDHDWEWVSDEYDGEGDPRSGTAESKEAAILAIYECIDECKERTGGAE